MIFFVYAYVIGISHHKGKNQCVECKTSSKKILWF